jgi:hypothetical protein
MRPALTLALASLAATASVAASPPSRSDVSCKVSASDRAWLDSSVAAWRFTSGRLIHATLPRSIHAIFFDSTCTLSSTTAMTGRGGRWSNHRHDAEVTLPNGRSVPVAPTSFTSSNGKGTYFVMALPSVWSGKVDPGRMPLGPFVIAVMMHEASHVAQQATYGARMDRLSKRWNLPASFGDDSIQDRFKGNREFAASVDRETRLLFDAAASPRRAQARRLASEARHLIRARQQKWYPPKEAYLAPAEDIWLTMEGSGQWAAYRWLTSGQSGVSREVAYSAFATRGDRWTQLEGIALFLAVERLLGDDWTRDVFGRGGRTALQWLDLSLRSR